MATFSFDVITAKPPCQVGHTKRIFKVLLSFQTNRHTGVEDRSSVSSVDWYPSVDISTNHILVIH